MSDLEEGQKANLDLAEDDTEKVKLGKRSLQLSRSFTGPIPPPEILYQYDQIGDDFANRIIKMAEKEQSHRHSLQDKTIQIQSDELKGIRDQKRIGQICGLTIGLVSILSGSSLVAMGHAKAGTIIATGAVLGLVSVFVIGKTSTAEEEEIGIVEDEFPEDIPPKDEQEMLLGQQD